MNRNVAIVGVLASVALVALAAWRGAAVPFGEQWPFFEALRTTAAIIFAVVGAWLAIIYPERLRVSYRDEEKTVRPVGARFGELFVPIVNSSAILCIVLLIGVLAPIVRRLEVVTNYPGAFRGASYALLASLTLWQLWTVVLTLIPADIIKSNADAERSRNEAIGARMRMGSTAKPVDSAID